MAFDLSVKQKIVLSLWVTTFLLLVLAGTISSVWFVQDQSKRLDDFLTGEVRGVHDTLQVFFSVHLSGEGAEDTLTSNEFRTFLEGYLQDRTNRAVPYKTTLGVFGPAGDLVQSSNSALSLVTDLTVVRDDIALTTIHGPPNYRMALVRLEKAGHLLGTVRMACLTVTLGEVWNSFLFSLMLVLILIFVSFGFLGSALIHWSLRPVKQMSLSAQDISESHLDLRLAVPSGQDELAEMARTLNRLLDRLERDFQFEEALVGQLSHELRTPLTILRGRNEVALQRLSGAQAALRPLLEDNLADIDTIGSLLSTLLSLARFDGRIDPVRLVPCDLGELLSQLIEELGPLWEEKEQRLQLELPGGATRWSRSAGLMVMGDGVLLRQVFLNLLTNAYKYTPRGGRIDLMIKASGSASSPVWSLVVHNPGPAIPEESLELVFKRFYRVETQDPDRFERESGLGQRGFGLGLSIAKTLIELHHGTIRAFNPPEGGAAFEVTLPLVAATRTESRDAS